MIPPEGLWTFSQPPRDTPTRNPVLEVEFDPSRAAASRSEGTATVEEDGVFTGETTHQDPRCFDCMYNK